MAMSEQSAEARLKGPALQPPPGDTPHLLEPLDPPMWYIIIVSITTSLAGMMMILRYCAKLSARRKLDRADYTLFSGFAGYIAVVVIGRFAVIYGAGVHQWNLKLQNFFNLLFWINIFQIIYGPTIFCIKATIILQYISIFSPQRSLNRFMFYGGWSTFFVNLIFYIIRTVFNIVYCAPREKIWNKLLPGGHCVRNYWFITSSGFINAVSDIVLLILPVSSLWALRISRKRKVQISLLFATGFLAFIASCMRIYYGFKATIGRDDTRDSSLYMGYEGTWAYAEMSLGIFVACSLSIPKVLKSSAGIRSVFARVKLLFSQASATDLIGQVDSTAVQATPKRKKAKGKDMEMHDLWRHDSDAESQAKLNKDIHVTVDITQTIERLRTPPASNMTCE